MSRIGGKGGVTVPNKYPSGGMCTNIDPKAANHAPDGKGNPHVKKQVQWCTKIGSKKKKCKVSGNHLTPTLPSCTHHV